MSPDIVKEGRNFLHKRDPIDEVHVDMIKRLYHYNEDDQKIMVTILKSGGGVPSEEAMGVLSKLFNFTVVAEDDVNSECWLFLQTMNLEIELTSWELDVIEDVIIRPIERPVVMAAFSQGVSAEKADIVRQTWGYS